MSRKTPPKSNIGIFQGKESKYNKQILKTLLTNGPSTSWGIAKKLCVHKYPDINDELLMARSRKIYSVLQRKRGRLQSLLAKEYVAVKGKKWGLTLKGITAALILDPKLINKVHLEWMGSFDDTKKMDPSELMFGPFMISKKAADNLTEVIETELQNPKQLLLRIAKIAENLIAEGIDLDRFSCEKFELLAAKEYSEKHFVKQLQNKVFETEKRFHYKVCSKCGRKVVGESFSFCPFCANRLES